MNISNFLHNNANKLPDHIAFYDVLGKMTYSELSHSVTEVAKILSNYNIGSNCAIGVVGNNSRYFVIMNFAVMQTGAVVMPIASGVSADELQTTIETAHLNYLITESDLGIKLNDKHLESTIDLPFNRKLIHTLPINKNKNFIELIPDAAFIRFTSGTTGKSKGVILSHQTIADRTATANSSLKLNENDTIMWLLPMAYHFVVSIILYIRYGCSIIINNEFLASRVLDEINTFKATFVYASPLHIRMLASDKSQLMMPHVKRVISTSTSISNEHCTAFWNRFKISVSQAYGIIEAGLPVINFDASESSPESIGFAAKGFVVEILDDNFNIVDADIEGNLAIRGPGMFDAYLSPLQLQKDVLQSNWFMTGDLAVKNNDGLITVRGRKKSVINVAGNKVFPEEVEVVLKQHPAIEECKVSSLVHSLLGECVQAEIQLRKNLIPPDVEEILKFCRSKLSSYKVPQKVVFVNNIQMTGSGKIKR